MKHAFEICTLLLATSANTQNCVERKQYEPIDTSNQDLGRVTTPMSWDFFPIGTQNSAGQASERLFIRIEATSHHAGKPFAICAYDFEAEKNRRVNTAQDCPSPYEFRIQGGDTYPLFDSNGNLVKDSSGNTLTKIVTQFRFNWLRYWNDLGSGRRQALINVIQYRRDAKPTDATYYLPPFVVTTTTDELDASGNPYRYDSTGSAIELYSCDVGPCTPWYSGGRICDVPVRDPSTGATWFDCRTP